MFSRLFVAVAIVGGNCNNGSHCGLRYLNVNNAASNANWNIGASLSYPNGGTTNRFPRDH